MLAQERCELTKEEKAEIEELAKQTKAYSELLLKKYPPEPEDSLTWPFEEYK
jgi:hypothetical protein